MVSSLGGTGVINFLASRRIFLLCVVFGVLHSSTALMAVLEMTYVAGSDIPQHMPMPARHAIQTQPSPNYTRIDRAP